MTTTASHAGSRTGEIVRNVKRQAARSICFQNISTAYRLRTGGELLAVAGLTFEVRKNEVLGLLGPNGAGKTTLLKMLTTLLYPTAGSILVDGLDVQKHGREVRARIGWVPANRQGPLLEADGRGESPVPRGHAGPSEVAQWLVILGGMGVLFTAMGALVHTDRGGLETDRPISTSSRRMPWATYSCRR